MARVRGRRLGAVVLGAALVAAGCIPGPARDNYPQQTFEAPVGTTVYSLGNQCFSEAMVLRVEASSAYNYLAPSGDGVSNVEVLTNNSPDYSPIGAAAWAPVPGHPDIATRAQNLNSACYDLAIRVRRATSATSGHIRIAFSTLTAYRIIPADEVLRQSICASGYERLELVATGSPNDAPVTAIELRSGATVVSGTWSQVVDTDIYNFPVIRTVSPTVVPKGCYTANWTRTSEAPTSQFTMSARWFPGNWDRPWY